MSHHHSVAIVTGASRGLGLVIAGVLADLQHHLLLAAREAEPLERAAGDLRRRGVEVATVAGDVADPGVRHQIVERAQALGTLRALVNNASELGRIAPLVDASAEQAQRVFNVNVIAPLGLVALSAPALARSKGLVVNVSSDAAIGAYPGWGVYGASKAALDLMTRTLAGELHERGIALVSVDPGDMRTRMHQEAFPGQDISDRPLPEVTAPFWKWLFDQAPHAVTGQRFAAQSETGPWLTALA